METELRAELKGNGKQQPVFEGLEVKAELLETLGITTITQSYRNSGTRNMEAVYIFPLPLDAVLLEMTVTLGQKTLKGTVLPKKEAEEKYEEAIIDGDAPIMLQTPQPGLYTMNVGNLLPGEKAVITIRYGMFLNWQRETLRYHLPTTIAPRYGSAEQGGLEARQEPETSILVDNLYSFAMTLRGALAGMVIESPSHGIEVERSGDGRESRVSLSKRTDFMDRDLIITVRKQDSQAASAVVVQDGESCMVWGSFQPRLDLPEDLSPRSIKIVVDCSGSMQGDSITQAKEALLRILDELRPQDWFNLVAFGNTAVPLFNSQVKASNESLAYARGYLQKLDADMGGTEIGYAIDMALGLRCPEKVSHDVLLITDGEIWEWERIVGKAKKSDHRFFTIGVGCSVSEAFVRTLAEQTEGACELVSPGEQMAERIHRHFRRIATPCGNGTTVTWPATVQRQFPDRFPRVYDGDTVNLFGWFDQKQEGEVTLRIPLPDKGEQTLKATIETMERLSDDLPRMAAAMRLKQITEQLEGEQLALRYQLMSRWTNYLAIVQRDDGAKAETLPELHKVQQMLAAGWGGAGSVMYSSAPCPDPMPMAANAIKSKAYPMSAPSPSSFSFDYVSEPEELQEPVEQWVWDQEDQNELKRFITLIDFTLVNGVIPQSINLPLLPQRIGDLMAESVREGLDEQTIVTAFLHHLAESLAGTGFSRQARRVIAKQYKSLQADTTVLRVLEEKFRT